MIHLENHPHALLKNGIVTNVVLLQEHDNDLLHSMLSETDNDSYLSACETGNYPYIGGDVHNGKFRSPAPHPAFLWDNSIENWKPPVEKIPDTATEVYIFDIPSWSWIAMPRTEAAPISTAS